MPTITIAIVAEKGGAGKTTTTISLGSAWATSDRRTLVIDLDPQASLTRGLIGSDETNRLPAAATIAALFDDVKGASGRLIVPTPFENLSLLRGSRSLKRFNRLSPSEFGTHQFAVRNFLKDVADRFDRVLIDTPPNLEFLSWASLTAANYVLTPVRADDYGAQSLQFVNTFVATVRASTNPRLTMLGYVRNAFQQRATIHRYLSDRINDNFPGMLFENSIPQSMQFLEALAVRTPLAFFKPRTEAAKAVARVMDEIEQRMQKRKAAAA